jgi:hypothetical protein
VEDVFSQENQAQRFHNPRHSIDLSISNLLQRKFPAIRKKQPLKIEAMLVNL